MFVLRFSTASAFFAFLTAKPGATLYVHDAGEGTGTVIVGADWEGGRAATCDEVLPGSDPRLASAYTVGGFSA